MSIPSSAASAVKSGANLIKGTPPPVFTGLPGSVLGKVGGAIGAIVVELAFPESTVSESAEQAAIARAKKISKQGGTEEIEAAPPPPFKGGQMSGIRYELRVTWTEYNSFGTPSNRVGTVSNLLGAIPRPPEIRIEGNGIYATIWENGNPDTPATTTAVIKYPNSWTVDSGSIEYEFIRTDGQPDTGGNLDTGGGINSAPPPNLSFEGGTIAKAPPGTRFAGLSDGTRFPPGTILNGTGSKVPKPASKTPPPQIINSSPAGDIGRTSSSNNGSGGIGGQRFFIPTFIATGGITIPGGNTGSEANNQESASKESAIPKGNIHKLAADSGRGNLGGDILKDKSPTIEDLLRDGKKISTYPDSFLKHIDKHRSNRNATLTNSEILRIINQEDYQDSGITLGDISNGAIRTENEITFKDIIQTDAKTDTKTNTNVDADVKASDIELIAAAVAAVVFNPSNTQKLENAAAAGTCQTTQPGGCMQQNILNPLQQGQANLSSLFNNLGITGLATQNAAIKATVDNTNALLKNTSFGLEAIQNFAAKAWEATHADKVINVMNLLVATHNASMLSRNVGESIAELGTNLLSLLGIKDSKGETIDVGETIGNSISGAINAIVPEAIRTNISTTWLRLSKIHSAAVAMSSAVVQTKNALLEVNEITADWVARIGNTQQEQGIVEEDSYPWMQENNNFTDPYEGFLGKLNNAEDVIQQASSFVNSAIELQDSVQQLATSNEELKTALDEFNTTKTTEEADKETESTSPNIANTDLIKDEGETAGN